MEILESYLNEGTTSYLIALGVFILTTVAFILFKLFLLNKFRKIAKKTKNDFDDALVHTFEKIHWVFYFALAAWISFSFIELPPITLYYTRVFIYIIVAIETVRLISNLINYLQDKYTASFVKTHKNADITPIAILGRLIKLSLWFLAILLVISNLGYDVTSLVAGLGIGGIAIALAVQNILGELFSSLSIYLDKPFRPGDFIQVGEHRGKVKHIGIKSTRLINIHGEELIIPNKDLTSSRIQNYKLMEKRRVSFELDLSPKTTVKKLEIVPTLIESAIRETPLGEPVRVTLKNISGLRYRYRIVFTVQSKELKDYVETLQQVNLNILSIFKEYKISLSDKVDFFENSR